MRHLLLLFQLLAPISSTAQIAETGKVIGSDDIGDPNEGESIVVDMVDGREFVVKAITLGQGCTIVIEPKSTDSPEGDITILSVEGQCLLMSDNGHGIFVNTPIQIMRVKRYMCRCPAGRFATVNTYEMPKSGK